jgi:hypothetical protein
MGRRIQIGSGYFNIALPNGKVLSQGQTDTLTDAQWAAIPAGEIGTMIIDLGGATDTSNVLVLGPSDPVPVGTLAGTVIVRTTS